MRRICWFLLLVAQPLAAASFTVGLFENLPPDWRERWSFERLLPALQWDSAYLGLAALPGKISPIGFTVERTRPFALRVEGPLEFSAGEYEFHLRSAMYARFYIDSRLVLESEPPQPVKLTPEQVAAKEAEEKKAREDEARNVAEQQAREDLLRSKLDDAQKEDSRQAQEAVRAELAKVLQKVPKSDSKPPAAMPERVVRISLRAGTHVLRLEFTGDRFGREVSVVSRVAAGPLALLGEGAAVRFTEKRWSDWAQTERQSVRAVADAARRPLVEKWERSWAERHAGSGRGASDGAGIDARIEARLAANHVAPAALTGDYEFVRRVYLDTWGLIPTAEEIRAFVATTRPDKRDRLIDALLADRQRADPWVGYWEDVLAENPVIFGEVPNSTGPFKDWIYRSFVEDRGYDRLATELILMEGTAEEGGTLGFQISRGSDVPLAEKAMVISQAFLGANMKCARCHDSPVNNYRQRDLFGMAAMLNGAPVQIPATSSVGAVPGRRAPAVAVTTKPGEPISPASLLDADRGPALRDMDEHTFRAALADSITRHRRFAEVGVNRVWKRFMGTGLVEPVDDWPAEPETSHPELLDYLVNEFIHSGYSVRHIERIILKSRAYQRRRDERLAEAKDGRALPLFAAQPVRRMGAEELVDSLHRAVRREFKSERMAYSSVDYGYPKRTWQIVSLSNEEDNAVLMRPVLQEIIAMASSFGWRDQRPNPISVRSADSNPLQPLAMANGALMDRLVRLSDASYYTRLSNRDITLPEFIDELLLNTLSRPPRESEKQWISERLGTVWENRRVAPADRPRAAPQIATEQVRDGDTAAAHLYVQRVRAGEPATASLTDAYRKGLEAVLWVILNSPEFLFVP